MIPTKSTDMSGFWNENTTPFHTIDPPLILEVGSWKETEKKLTHERHGSVLAKALTTHQNNNTNKAVVSRGVWSTWPSELESFSSTTGPGGRARETNPY